MNYYKKFAESDKIFNSEINVNLMLHLSCLNAKTVFPILGSNECATRTTSRSSFIEFNILSNDMGQVRLSDK